MRSERNDSKYEGTGLKQSTTTAATYLGHESESEVLRRVGQIVLGRKQVSYREVLSITAQHGGLHGVTQRSHLTSKFAAHMQHKQLSMLSELNIKQSEVVPRVRLDVELPHLVRLLVDRVLVI
jgi:hypothetical protein